MRINQSDETNDFLKIYEIYKLAKISVLKNEEHIINNKYFHKLSCKEVYNVFNAIFKYLNMDEKRLFENSFASKHSPFWWKDYYSKSTYYRLRKQTIYKILYYLQGAKNA